MKGLPVLEGTMLGGMASGVLVGLLIADSTLPSKSLISPRFPPAEPEILISSEFTR